MSTHEDLGDSEARAAKWADEFLSRITQPVDSNARTMAYEAMKLGWIVGYKAALSDVVIMRDNATELKH